ncbi:MAG: hypothetical protein ACLFWF_09185 [Alphaproteobacteria bacterium]
MREVNEWRCEDRFTGAALPLAAAGSILAMAHHPVSVHGTGGIGDYVHGAMIVLLSVLFYGFARFAQRRDLRRAVILAGLVAYGLGFAATVGAGIVNGFIVPALAARGPGQVGQDIFILCREANQSLAALGVFATGAAFLLWSMDFLARAELSNRITGIAGLLAALLPAGALAAGLLELSVAGAFLIYSSHALWAALVGIQFIRRKI